VRISLIGRALAVALLFCASPAFAEPSECPDPKGLIAETDERHMTSWADLKRSFKRLPGCDDGVLAEGYSDFVARTLAHRWNRLADLATLTSDDPAFQAFVLKHIDASADSADLQQLELNAKARCPSRHERLCASIHEAAVKALKRLKDDGLLPAV